MLGCLCSPRRLVYAILIRLQGLEFAHVDRNCLKHGGYGHSPSVWFIGYVVRSLGLPESWEILDIGSGKGAAAFMFCRHFRKVRGIELDKELHDAALRNLRACPKSNIEFTCGDATTVSDLPEVIYLFNPFGEKAMKMLCSNIGPRTQKIIYTQPEFGHVLVANGWTLERAWYHRDSPDVHVYTRLLAVHAVCSCALPVLAAI